MKVDNNIVFLDIDGCLTSVETNTFFNPNPSEYHPIKQIVDSIIQLCDDTHSKIVLSTNWRKFDIDGTYHVNGGILNNPIREVQRLLGKHCIGLLPAIRHVTKSQALILWFEDNDFNGNFVIFDDDNREDFQTTGDYNISKHFILVDRTYGITSDDIRHAKEILSTNKI